MPRPRKAARGFSMIEMMVVVAIIAIVASFASLSLIRARPRANLTGAAVELHSLLHGARQQALTSGNEVVVMIFPGHVVGFETVGRVVVYEDGDHDFFDDAAAVNFDDYDPAKRTAGAKSEVITTMDLPPAVRIGPEKGMGDKAVLPAPLATIPVTLDCTFCAGDKDARRGAIVFDARGRARFQSGNGPALAVDGGSLSLEVPALGVGGQNQVRTLAVVGSTGAIRSFNNG